ncbi:MAG: hypothetical protein H0U76_26470 [Ktedonobacteraceae bacterium]|nr:hypothetical protein [Ktedonobacteraceae bacterium]
MPLTFIATAVGLGIAYAAAPGAVNTEAIRRCVAISGCMRWGRRWLRPAMFHWINALCGLALGYFGIRVLWTTAQVWLDHYVLPSLKPGH